MLSVIVADKQEDVAAADQCKLTPRPLHIKQVEVVRIGRRPKCTDDCPRFARDSWCGITQSDYSVEIHDSSFV